MRGNAAHSHPGMQVWTAVHQVFLGYRLRRYLSATVPPWLVHNVPEDEARRMFNATPRR